MRTIIAVTAIVGFARGKTILVTNCNCVAPSIIAASSISTGMVSKYPFIFHNANTAIVPVYTIISPVLVLINPIGDNNLYNAVIESNEGNAYSNINILRMALLPGKSFLFPAEGLRMYAEHRHIF